MKKEILAIEVADFPIHFSFGGVEQDEFLVQSEKIGALPHFARVHKVLGLLAIPFSTGERVQVVPFAKINRPIQQDSAALAALPGANAHVPGAVVAPQARIAEARDFGVARWQK